MHSALRPTHTCTLPMACGSWVPPVWRSSSYIFHWVYGLVSPELVTFKGARFQYKSPRSTSHWLTNKPVSLSRLLSFNQCTVVEWLFGMAAAGIIGAEPYSRGSTVKSVFRYCLTSQAPNSVVFAYLPSSAECNQVSILLTWRRWKRWPMDSTVLESPS